MARYAKIAAISMDLCAYTGESPEEILKTEIAYVDTHLKNVLPDKPDLIVLPEVCDRQDGMSISARREYIKYRGDRFLDHIKEVAKENNCYIGFGTDRFMEDGTTRNSFCMVDRQGSVLGYYDKNYLVPRETANMNALCGEDMTVFECDFGRVVSLLCFDLNFEEVRKKCKDAKPDLVIFSSMFGGGIMRNFFALDTRSYFVSACGYQCPGVIIDPLGQQLATTANHFNFIVRTLNLDYKVVHLDDHRPKLLAMKAKYGDMVEITDIGYIGVLMVTNNMTDRTVDDVLKEFEIIDAETYFANARAHRAKYTAKN